MNVNNVISIVLTSLLIVSCILNTAQYKQNVNHLKVLSENAATIKYLEHSTEELRKELENSPKQFIEITKGVQKELCSGEYGVRDVLSLPPTAIKEKGGSTDVSTKVYVDIDAELPADLIRLLNEDD